MLFPQGDGPVKRVIHFIGGAFVGASPQLSYRLFLEKLSDRGGCVIVATPYALNFDQLRCAEEAQFKFDSCMRTLTDKTKSTTINNNNDNNTDKASLLRVPSFGVGHSLGSLLHLFIGSRYSFESSLQSSSLAQHRQGNILLSFNNKPVSDAVPVLSPLLAPFTSSAAEAIVNNTQSNPFIAVPLQMMTDSIKNSSNSSSSSSGGMNSNDLPVPAFMKQALPMLEQVTPLLADVGSGTREFLPAPDEAKRLIRTYYCVQRNCLIKFRDDSIDETPTLANMLTNDSAISSRMDLAVKTIAGDHLRPLKQKIVSQDFFNSNSNNSNNNNGTSDNYRRSSKSTSTSSLPVVPIPDEFVVAAESGTDFLNSLVDMADGAGMDKRSTAPLRDIASISSEVSSSLRRNNDGTGNNNNSVSNTNVLNSLGDLAFENEKDIEELVEIIVDWMESSVKSKV